MATKSNGRRQHHYSSASKKTTSLTEKAAVGLFSWATTDHSHMTRALNNMPSGGVIEQVKYLLLHLLILLVGGLIVGVTTFVLVGYVVPFLLSALFW